ncbi:MAG: GNAT family N-acetyltransferase, partial [Myxococcales bacterium]|nr:GNAT family N-acetyltransferase [Myxococcales bacterium]
RLLSLTVPQLQAALRTELDGRRIPPSEVASALADVDQRLERLRVGELGEAELREQLVVLINIYRQRFVPNRRGDRLTLEELERVFARRGVDWGASFGAFLDGRLVAVIMTAVDPWPAAHTGAYGVLTAVRKGAQDRGVLTALFDWLKIALERREVTHMQIEALVDDPRARTAYERLGFDGERHLFCFDLPGLSRPQRFIEELSFEVHEGPLALAAQESRG